MKWRRSNGGAAVPGLRSNMGFGDGSRRRRPAIVVCFAASAVAVVLHAIQLSIAFLGSGPGYSTGHRRSQTFAKTPLGTASRSTNQERSRSHVQMKQYDLDVTGSAAEILYDEPSSSDGARARIIIYAKGLDDYLKKDEGREDAWQLTSAVAERPLGHNVRQWESMDSDIIGKKYRGDVVHGKLVEGGDWVQLSGEPGFVLIRSGETTFLEKVRARRPGAVVPVGIESPEKLGGVDSDEFEQLNPNRKVPMLKLPGYTTYAGCQCTGSAPDLASGFVGTVKECMAKCDELGGEGFVYVRGADGESTGTAYFRGGFLSTPIPYSADDRDTYKKDRITAIYEIDPIARYLIDKYADVEPSFIPRTPEVRALDNLLARVHDEYIAGAANALVAEDPPFGEHGSRWEAIQEMQRQLKVIANLSDDDGPFLTGGEIAHSDVALFPTMVLMKHLLPKFHEPKAKFHINDRVRRNRTSTRVWAMSGVQRYRQRVSGRVEVGAVVSETQLQEIASYRQGSVSEIIMDMIAQGEMQKTVPYYGSMQYTKGMGGGASMATGAATATPGASGGFDSPALSQQMMYEKEGTVVGVDAYGDPNVKFDVRIWTAAGVRKYGSMVTGDIRVNAVVTESQLEQLGSSVRRSLQSGMPPIGVKGLENIGGLRGVFSQGQRGAMRGEAAAQLGEDTMRSIAFQNPQEAILREMIALQEVQVVVDEETVWVKGRDFEIIGQVFAVGDRVKSVTTGKEGMVTEVDTFGDPKVKFDRENEEIYVYGKDFELVRGNSFSINDRVMRRSTGKEGTVVDVDSFGDPIVRFDGEDEALQCYGKDFEVIPDFGKARAPFSQDRREVVRDHPRREYRQYYRQDYFDDYPRVWTDAGVRKYGNVVSGYCDVGAVVSDEQLETLARSGRKQPADLLREMVSLGEVQYRLREGYEWSEFESFGPKLLRWWKHMTSGAVPAADRVKMEMETALVSMEESGHWDKILHAGKRDGGDPTLFDDILYRAIPSDILFEDERCIVVKEVNPTAPVHLLVIPKRRDGLTQFRNASQDHEYILGHLMRVASEQGRIAVGERGGFRVVVNDHAANQNAATVQHLHLHVIGGRVLNWPPG